MAKANKPKKIAKKKSAKKGKECAISNPKAWKVEYPEGGEITSFEYDEKNAVINMTVGESSEDMHKFTPKEKLFTLCYVANYFNGTQAAIEAGYSEHSAASIASENLRKPHIKAEIDRLVSERLMSKEETIMHISDMARGSLNDYLRIVKRATRPTVKKSLHVLIAEINAKIEDQEKFVTRAGNLKKERLDRFAANIETWLEQILEYEIELERNPGAYREVQGEEVIEDVVELDLVKLAQDKQRGRIKSLKPDKSGSFEVELYAADGALRDIGRYHGIFEKDNRRLNLNSEPLTPEEIKAISQELDNKY